MLSRRIYTEDIETYRWHLASADNVTMSGRIKYNPKRPNLKKKTECCIIEFSHDLCDLYRSMLNKQFGLSLKKPSWEGHISVVSAKEVLYLEKNKPLLLKQFWHKYNGNFVDFSYSVFPRFSGDTDVELRKGHGLYWFLDVKCDKINMIRNELGLNNLTTAHLTIAKNS